MKKLTALALAILMLASLLAACGSDSDSKKESSVDLKGLLSDINTEFDISETTVQGLKILESTDELDRYYMISGDDIKQFAAERTSSSTDFTEIVIVEANGSEEVDKIVKQLNSRLDAQRNTAKSYNPDSVEVLEKCEVKTSGNFVYMVINDKCDEINQMIEDKIA